MLQARAPQPYSFGTIPGFNRSVIRELFSLSDKDWLDWIKVRSLPGRTFTGTVALIYPQVNMENRTVRVRIEIPNPEGLLLPDMFADVEFATGSDAPVIAVPDGAVIDTGTRQIVIVDKGDSFYTSGAGLVSPDSSSIWLCMLRATLFRATIFFS